MERVFFETMSDDRVLERVEALVVRSNALTAELLTYLGEVDRRGLYLREATSSLFAFCVERLHMSEAAAGKRITAARVAQKFPRVLDMVARGEIHLAAINLLARHLTDENHEELLLRVRHRSKRDIEKLVAEIAPRPDVPPRVMPVSRPGGGPGLEEAGLAIAAVSGEHAPGRVTAAERVGAARAALIAPLSPQRYEIRVTVGEEAHAALTQLQDLLSHQVPDGDPAIIISRALELLLKRTLGRKAAVTSRPRAAAKAVPHKRTRPIPAEARREVWLRDGGRCAYRDASGRRCSSTRFLEFHHINNWARGAEHSASEIELRCRAHNQYQAVLDYGAKLIAARRASRAGEPRRSYRCESWPATRVERPVICGQPGRGDDHSTDSLPRILGDELRVRSRAGSGRLARGEGEVAGQRDREPLKVARHGGQARSGGTLATRAFSSTWATVFMPTSAVPMPGAERAYCRARCALVRSGPSPRSPGPRGR